MCGKNRSIFSPRHVFKNFKLNILYFSLRSCCKRFTVKFASPPFGRSSSDMFLVICFNFQSLLLRKWSSFNADEDPCFCFCCRHVSMLTFISIFNAFYYLLLRKWFSFNLDEDPYFCFCCRHVGCWGMTKFVNLMQNINNQCCQRTFVDICFNFQCFLLLNVTKMIFI